jgi:hypothetical protein
VDIPLPGDTIDLTVLDRAKLLCSGAPLPSLAKSYNSPTVSPEQELVESAIRLHAFTPFDSPRDAQNYVVNKLITEVELAVDPKIRLRSLELLGKTSQVDLFKESKEITITHRSTGEIEDRLKSKLEKYMGAIESAIETVDYATV